MNKAAARAVSVKVIEHRARHERLLLRIDRLDYTKGIPRRLAAIEHLLFDHPEWQGNIRFLQLAVPSRDSEATYRGFRQEVERLVTRINGRFATPEWTPIHYVHQPVCHETMLALYAPQTSCW